LEKKSDLKTSNFFGINGGFFELGSNDIKCFNIAVSDGKHLGSEITEIPIDPKELETTLNGTGLWNGVGSGVIYYDGHETKYQFTLNAANISGISNPGTWAQGGISMFLGKEDWKGKDDPYNYYGIDAKASGRTALVTDKSNNVYLIVTDTHNSMREFRGAIQKYFGISEGNGENAIYTGLFLDGSGSSQLKCIKSEGSVFNVRGDSRKLAQVIYLVDED
jgi:hypothetical protein